MTEPLPAKLVLATGNPSKARELRALLQSLPTEILDLSRFPDVPETIEDGATLRDNARIKAEAAYRHCKMPALADDTGLEVAALNGLPGVRSARYAGRICDARANRAKLLRDLEDIRERQARFVTVLALVDASGTLFVEGQCAGQIALREMTSAGFGYESLFVPDGHTRCLAQLTIQEKNALSHRGMAARKLIRQLLSPHDRPGATRS